jgi:hypothetical protein
VAGRGGGEGRRAEPHYTTSNAQRQEGPLLTFKLPSCIIMDNFTDVYYKRNVPSPHCPNLFSSIFIFPPVSDVEKGFVYVG